MSRMDALLNPSMTASENMDAHPLVEPYEDAFSILDVDVETSLDKLSAHSSYDPLTLDVSSRAI